MQDLHTSCEVSAPYCRLYTQHNNSNLRASRRGNQTERHLALADPRGRGVLGADGRTARLVLVVAAASTHLDGVAAAIPTSLAPAEETARPTNSTALPAIPPAANPVAIVNTGSTRAADGAQANHRAVAGSSTAASSKENNSSGDGGNDQPNGLAADGLSGIFLHAESQSPSSPASRNTSFGAGTYSGHGTISSPYLRGNSGSSRVLVSLSSPSMHGDGGDPAGPRGGGESTPRLVRGAGAGGREEIEADDGA